MRPLRAAPRSAEAETEARAHYDQGIVAYNAGQFDQAVRSFTRAYELDPAPILLFNVAQAHRKQGDAERALSFYRQYLAIDPQADNRQQVEAHIRELEAARRPVLVAPAPPLPASAPPVPTTAGPPPVAVTMAPVRSPPLYRRPWFWGAVGAVGVAALVAVLTLRSDRPWTCGPGCPTHTVQ
jgi:tetratricopeptide (TPR) repeat protein